jgi:hypothetical protein
MPALSPVSGGSFGSQDINTVKWDPQDEQFLKDVVEGLDESIDLDFNFTSNQSTADIGIFLDTRFPWTTEETRWDWP